MVSSTRRVDCKRKFYLVLGMQEYFKKLRSRKDIAPYRQTQSEKVMTVQSLTLRPRMPHICGFLDCFSSSHVLATS